ARRGPSTYALAPRTTTTSMTMLTCAPSAAAPDRGAKLVRIDRIRTFSRTARLTEHRRVLVAKIRKPSRHHADFAPSPVGERRGQSAERDLVLRGVGAPALRTRRCELRAALRPCSPVQRPREPSSRSLGSRLC